jgi:hypothetical protein
MWWLEAPIVITKKSSRGQPFPEDEAGNPPADEYLAYLDLPSSGTAVLQALTPRAAT